MRNKRIEHSCPYIDNVKDKIQNCIDILIGELDNLEKIRDINYRLRNDRNDEVKELEDENRDLKKKIDELEYEVKELEEKNQRLIDN
jgi:predicted RNase H-like nuclease (RuvC/YqgF family)